ncbi:hypothetical protein [Paraburkholderia sp. J12]|uniref:hypothetical protein n=1 Tax=Paraburkholderia sp. J12 TaxID=2805432 RepID=UPI002ABDD5A7|nr:hypothetical protein [Paraburkholderia sp. J12]
MKAEFARGDLVRADVPEQGGAGEALNTRVSGHERRCQSDIVAAGINQEIT